jgi:hypothetical protein
VDRAQRHRIALGAAFAALAAAGGCGGPLETLPSPYATEVVGFTPGDGAGYGSERFPEVVLGGPTGRGMNAGSTDVLSLGSGGTVTLSWSGRAVIDRLGIDFVVFENAFWPGGDATRVFAELAEVSVSEDGEIWHTFECDPAIRSPYDAHCAGWRPTANFDPLTARPLDPQTSGGDGFDLADLGLTAIRYVRLRDLSEAEPIGTGTGFDLDAVGAVAFEDAR